MAAPVAQSAQDAEATRRDSGSLFGLLRRLTDAMSTLFRQEMNLTAAEVHHSPTSRAAGGGLMWPRHSLESIQEDKDVLTRNSHA